MCGIIGYLGGREAFPILLKGLERIEYRGYDSVGICTSDNSNFKNGKLHLLKDVGRIGQFKNSHLPGKQGLAHSRWATHGSVCPKNAHPFVVDDTFTLVHNGIIENYLELKEELRQQGAVFSSDTDSEVIAHLIARKWRELSLQEASQKQLAQRPQTQKLSAKNNYLLEAVQQTVKLLRGAYAFVVMHKDFKEIVAARNGCPLIIGLGEKENFIASDIAAFIEFAKNVIYVNDFEVVRLSEFEKSQSRQFLGDQVELFGINGEKKNCLIKEIQWNIEQAQKQGFPHFMLKEIMEQPQTIAETLNASFSVQPTLSNLQKAKRIILVACGTASYAGLVGKYLIETIAKIPVVHETASEFRYKEPLFGSDDLVIVISQSGETADTLAAVRLAKEHGVKTMGIVNVMESTIAREVDSVVYTRAGPEIGVASTKAFTAQLIILYKLAYLLTGKEFFAGKENEEAQKLTSLIERTLKLEKQIQDIAQRYFHYQHFLYIGRNRNFPLALEGALKLKEISYIHAEAFPAGELKHGPIALVSEEVPTVAICPKDETYDKMLNNIQEIKARKGKVIAIATEGDEKISSISDDAIYLPVSDTLLTPLLAAIPLQLLAYHIANIKECDIDKPRNLAKSVTVE